MSNIIVPGQQSQPQYPQINAQATPQGIIFTIALGPTISLLHIISHDDMEHIEAMRREELRKMREQQRIANEVMQSHKR